MNEYKKIVKRKDLLFPELSYKIVGSAFDVHNNLGSGHYEKYYQKALAESFSKNQLKYQEQIYLPLKYNNKIVGKNFLDFLVEEKVVVEIKKDSRFAKSHINQVLEYLKLSNLQLAILINFGSESVSFKRIININS
jgi:GxxExxY protein